MKITKKKESELYDIVREEIMQARIKMLNLSRAKCPNLSNELDNILSDLSKAAPEKAINIFKTN